MPEKPTFPQDDVRIPVPRPRREDMARHEETLRYEEPSRNPQYSSAQARPSNNSFSLPQDLMADWWRIIRRHKVSVLISILSFAAAAVIVTKLQTPIYESHSALEYLPPGQLPAALRDGSGGPDASDASLDASMQTYVSLLQNDGLLSQVIGKLKLDQRSDFLADSASPLWARWAKFRPAKAEPPAKRALKIASHNLGVR
ncbi:MAG TPA: Wzz/FepE/Etk N-terminal domain-containing protein, partial [Bryobacteraceae bacterium]|nr:Wzz/FepE/Etk N-terminal domain-containing protein [Bryobacteraceae bacterium]